MAEQETEVGAPERPAAPPAPTAPEPQEAPDATSAPDSRPTRTPQGWAGDVAVTIALLVVLAFAPSAYLFAGQLPIPAQVRTPPIAPVGGHPNVPLRSLPAGLPAGFTANDPADLRALARQALGDAGAERLLALLSPATGHLVETAVGGSIGSAPYPYRYPALTRLLDQAPAQAGTAAASTLGAALLMLASRFDTAAGAETFPNASPAAFAVLDRARTGRNDCAAQLNLLLLVSADDQPRHAPVRMEAARAESACPGDPTPGWVLEQYQSQIAGTFDNGIRDGDPIPPDAPAEALATATRLDKLFPGSAAMISALADVEFRTGLLLQDEGKPFTARQALRAAAAHYTDAQALGSTEARVGLGRALIGLGEPARAAALLRSIPITEHEPAGALLEVLTTAEEQAHQFAQAQASAEQLLALAASGAYPGRSALFAVPYGDNYQPETGHDPLGPQSVGSLTRAPFTVSLQPAPGGADAPVNDFAFIPTFRASPRILALNPACPDGAWRRDAILAGQASLALVGLPAGDLAEFRDVRPTGEGCWLSVQLVGTLAQLEAGRTVPGNRDTQNAYADERQNLWRWAGNLPRAEAVIKAWALAAGPAAAAPARRLGEVQFLQGHYDDAAETFAVSARRARQASYLDDLDVDEAQLDRGGALLLAGRRADGTALLRSLTGPAEQGAVYQQTSIKDTDAASRFAAVAYHAHALLADAERESGELHAAVEDYDAARDMLTVLKEGQRPTGLKPERLDANEAIAQLGLSRLPAATAAIERALAADPMDPAFLMTAGYVAERAGKTGTAVAEDRAALASDQGAFPAANDLGVELARQGRLHEAETALRQTVGAREDYALGWFNLGVVYSRMGPAKVLAAQGAYARAFTLDHRLQDRSRQLTIDANTYRTGLDLSRPLPPRWSFATLQNLTPTPSAGLLAALLLGLGLARVAGTGASKGPAQDWLESVVGRLERISWLQKLDSPWWALSLTAVVFAVPILIHGSRTITDIVLVGLGVITSGLVVVRARSLVAYRAGESIQNQSWGPGIAFSLATAPIAPWAPLPVVREGRTIPRVHAVAPVVLALIGIVLFIETALWQLSFVRSLADAALVMAASVLVPIAPLDGATVSKTSLLTGIGVLVAALLVGVGVL